MIAREITEQEYHHIRKQPFAECFIWKEGNIYYCDACFYTTNKMKAIAYPHEVVR